MSLPLPSTPPTIEVGSRVDTNVIIPGEKKQFLEHSQWNDCYIICIFLLFSPVVVVCALMVVLVLITIVGLCICIRQRQPKSKSETLYQSVLYITLVLHTLHWCIMILEGSFLRQWYVFCDRQRLSSRKVSSLLSLLQ